MKVCRVRDSIEHLEETFDLSNGRRKLQVEHRNVQDELKKVVEDNQVTLALKAKSEHALAEVRA